MSHLISSMMFGIFIVSLCPSHAANPEVLDVEIGDNGMVVFSSGASAGDRACVSAAILEDEGVVEADEMYRFSISPASGDVGVVMVRGEPVDITILDNDSE